MEVIVEQPLAEPGSAKYRAEYKRQLPNSGSLRAESFQIFESLSDK